MSKIKNIRRRIATGKGALLDVPGSVVLWDDDNSFDIALSDGIIDLH